MDEPTSTRPRRQTTATADDSDDDIEIYGYKQARKSDRPRQNVRTKQSSAKSTTQQHGKGDMSSEDDDEVGDDGASGEAVDQANDESDFDEDEATQHPFYSYATEKSDYAADAKLIYQRHRMDTESESGGSPFLLAKSLTMPPGLGLVDGDSLLARTPSLSSRKPDAGQKNLASGLGLPAISPQSSREAHAGSRDGLSHPNERFTSVAAAAADIQARSHAHHPDLPHEFKDPLLSHEDVHGAGAGVGLGTGPDGFAKNESTVVSEVSAICEKIKHILDLRQAYMTVSNQFPGANPKDDESWNIYPAPPDPVWSEQKARPHGLENDIGSASSSLYITDPKIIGKDGPKWESEKISVPTPISPATAKRRRKAGTAIGEDFDINECEIPGRDSRGFKFDVDDGSVFQVHDSNGKPLVSVPTLRDYYMALDEILDIASDGPAKSFAYRRMQYLEGRYQLYTLLNEYEEVAETKKVPHRDFYNVRKVDTHVHHSACMNQKHLLRFIKSKMKKCPDEVVIDRDNKKLTLSEVFKSINLTAYDLSIDTLDMHAHTDSFHRFDKFNLKYNPIGQSRLRDIFLKTDNFIKGRYLADITREVISDLESSKYQMVEWRISIYGRNMDDWDKLAAWVVDNKLFSPNVRWLIQIPRLYSLYKSLNTMDNFEQLIKNIFQPLFEVTENPSTHPKLHIFLQRVIGFDSVDDESKPEKRFYRKFPRPVDWNTKQNPPYGYWIYYLFANMTSLNAWRKSRGFNTFLLRPHCGEAGDIDHLAAAVLCCHSISHGITLRKVPLLQYVFYLDQIGIAMSPLSNNALFLTYDRNPFISYFRKGLNVSLSTDDPLQFAFTKEPLIEEYSVAAQIYKLSAIDMCELAKHSVDQCGFELALKRRWLGPNCHLPGTLGNDVRKCNVPDIREAFRHTTLRAEHTFIARYTDDYTHLGRSAPLMPDSIDKSASVHEGYKDIGDSRQYYSAGKEASLPALATRPPASTNDNTTSIADKFSSSEIDKLVKRDQLKQPRVHYKEQQGQGQAAATATSPVLDRQRTLSRSSMHSKSSHADSNSAGISAEFDVAGVDRHISGHEPRAFPGILHGKERKRTNSIKSYGMKLVGSATWSVSGSGDKSTRTEQEKEHEDGGGDDK